MIHFTAQALAEAIIASDQPDLRVAVCRALLATAELQHLNTASALEAPNLGDTSPAQVAAHRDALAVVERDIDRLSKRLTELVQLPHG